MKALLIILISLSAISCQFELTDRETECEDWNKAIYEEIEVIKAGADKLTLSKLKEIEYLESLICK